MWELNINCFNLSELNILSENITYLTLACKSMKDLTSIEKLTGLAYLKIDIDELEDSTIPRTLTNLYTLYIYSDNIKRLEIPAELLSLYRLEMVCPELEELIILNELEDLDVEARNIKKLELPSSIEYLKIDSNEMEKFEISSELVNLFSVEISVDKLKELIIPKELVRLYRLDISSECLEKLVISENLNNLQYLEINADNLNSLILPNKMEKIYRLSIYADKLQTLNIPNELPEIYNLSIYADSLEQLEIPNSLNNLYDLTISCDNIVNLEIPENLPVLGYLSISGEKIKNLNFKGELPQISNFHLNTASIENLEISNKLKKVKNLNLYVNNIKELKISNELVELKNLSIDTNSEEFAVLEIPEELVNLEYIYLYSCLKEVKLPKTLTKLSNLVVSAEIENIIIPEEFINLEYLRLSSSQLKSIELPNTLEKLKEISISANQELYIEIPEELVNLEEISIFTYYDYDSDTDVEFFIPNTLTKLKRLYVSLTNLESLNIPSGLKGLKELEINCCDLKELIVGELESLNTLELLYCSSLEKLELPSKFSEIEKEEDYDYSNNVNKIIVEGLNLDEEVLKEIYTVENLKELEIDKEYGSYMDDVINLNGIEKLTQLESLKLNIIRFKDNSIEKIGELENLIGLKLIAEDDFNVEPISKLKKLQYLYAENLEVEDDDEDVIPEQPVVPEIPNVDRNVYFKYRDLPVYDEVTVNEEAYLFGFKLNDGETSDTVSKFKEVFDYTSYIEKNELENPNIKLFNSKGEELEDEASVGTGTKVAIYDGETKHSEFSILYYGDVDENGTADALDSLAIIKNNFTKNGFDTAEDAFKFSNDLYEEAGRIITENEDTPPGALDALAIVQQRFELYVIDQYKPLRGQELEGVG